MKLVFGLEADGRTYPDFPGAKSAVLGEAVVGPRGLLGILETQLGLTGPSKAEAIRIAAYAAKLSAALTARPKAFFAESFEKDRWSTAERLLRLRDDLVLAGWSKTAIGSTRIDDLAAAEAVLGNMPLGYADRHTIMLAALAEKPQLDIENIDAIESPGNLPHHISNLFTALKNCGVALNQLPLGQSAAKDNDLATVSQYLLKPSNTTLKGDGSFTIVRADTALLASEAVAEWLAADTEDALNDTVVICADGDTALLDQALKARGLPELGQSTNSPWRGALQVLPLAFGTIWKPFNPKPLMDLLLLPRPPISRSAARRLAYALSQEPGTGGNAWVEAWAAIHDKEVERLAGQPDAEETVAERIARWKEWTVGGQFDRKTGIPTDDAKRIAARVAYWAIRSGGADNDPLLLTVAGAANSFIDAIGVIGLDTLPALLIERMIEQVLAEGAENPVHIPKAGGLRCVKHPGAIWGPVKRTIWWSFCGPGEKVRAPADPWNTEENQALEKSDCRLATTAEVSQRISNAYTNAVYQTQEHMVLVRPALSGSDETTSHPLAHQLAPLLHKHQAQVNWTAEQILRQEKSQLANRTLARRTAATAGLPKQRKAWTLPATAIEKVRDRRETPTGLENLVNCQMRWLLQDVLRLSRGRFAEIPDTSQLLGNLAHEIAAQVFQPGKVLDQGKMTAEVSRLFDELVDAIAAPLHQPENAGEFVHARDHVPGSLAHLADFLRQKGLEIVGTETDRQKDLNDLKIGGRLDMLVKDAAGTLGVIDLKWTRSPRKRRDEVVNGTAIQLATYGVIADEATGKPVSGAYYMLNQKRLIGQRGGLVSEEEIDVQKDLGQTWLDVQATWKTWRDAAIAGNAIAGGIEGPPEPPEDIPIPASDEPCKFCGYSSLCRIASQEI